MSGQLVQDVLKHAPVDLKPAEMLVLISLAESARQSGKEARIAKYDSDVSSLSERTRLSPGTVRNALSMLTKRGLIRPMLDACRGTSQQYEIAKLNQHHRFNGAVHGLGKRHSRMTQSTRESVTPR